MHIDVEVKTYQGSKVQLCLESSLMLYRTKLEDLIYSKIKSIFPIEMNSSAINPFKAP